MLLPSEYRLINGTDFDAVPSCLYRAKSSVQARQLAQADWLIRDRVSGRYIATIGCSQTQFFQRTFASKQRILAVQDVFNAALSSECYLPQSEVSFLWDELQLDVENYTNTTGLVTIAEPVQLEYAGRDLYKRPLWLNYDAARAWLRMQKQASHEDILLFAISGYRSTHYQMGIFRRKLARGLRMSEILQVNAAPGFSEHHSGRAIDIGTTGEPPAEQSFEHTPAFNWLAKHAPNYGFRLSYPRNNPNGIAYEPWHWYWTGND